MRNSNMRKGFTAVLAAFVLTLMMTVNALAAATYIVQDGAFQNAGFINAGEAADGTITGPGNWTQLNLGDANVDAPYLHVILKAEGGDTSAAQIGVSDTYTYNLADLGATLTADFQDVVLPVQDNGIMLLSWLNLMGLDGGTVTYTVKDVFLSDDAAPTIAAAVEAPAEEAPAAEAEVPKTGESTAIAAVSFICLAGCAAVFAVSKRREAHI